MPAIIFALVIIASLLGLRWIRSEHLEALGAIPLFSLLSQRELLAVLRSAHAVAFQPGVGVIGEGEKGRSFFVITEGTARVTARGAELATLGSGSYFGEMAVIDGGPRTATITAQTQVSTLEITPSAFLHLVDREPRDRPGHLRGAVPALEGRGERGRRERCHLGRSGPAGRAVPGPSAYPSRRLGPGQYHQATMASIEQPVRARRLNLRSGLRRPSANSPLETDLAPRS